MVEKIIEHLLKNPEEASAVLEGTASLIGVDTSQIFEVFKFFASGQGTMLAGYWS